VVQISYPSLTTKNEYMDGVLLKKFLRVNSEFMVLRFAEVVILRI
jgi:hypothetical protein